MMNETLAAVLAATQGTSTVAGPMTLREVLMSLPDDLVLRRCEWIENTDADVTVRRGEHAPYRLQIIFEGRIAYLEEVGALV